MAGPQTIWGIDIGRCALKAVKLRAAGDGKVELIAHDYIEHAKILSQPDANRDELISNALEKFLSRNDLSKDRVVVGVPGQQTLARFTKLPPVTPKKIPDIVRYEADQQIPFDMDEVIWDYQTFQQEDTPDVEVGIFAMKRELIREHLLHLEQAQIEPIAVQTGPLAVYNAALFDGLLGKDTTILLDIGAENTDLIIATPYNLWTRSIAIGGNSFTEALVKSFKLSFSKAENLKRTASTSKYARQVFQAMRPIFADLVQELQRSIGFYSSTHRDANIEKVVCVGNAFKLPGLQKYLQQNLGLDVERPEAFKSMIESAATAAPQFTEHLLGFAVPYGLALQGLDLAKVTSNLLPAELAKQVVWSKKKPTFAAAAACILLAGGLIWFRQASDVSALRKAEAAPPPIRTREAAVAMIESGPPPSATARAGARQVFEAGKFLKNELSRLSSEGQDDAKQVEDLQGILHNKAVMPMLVQVVHAAVPQAADELGKANGVSDFLAAAAAGPPRPERKQVFVESLVMQYATDLQAEPDWEHNFFPEDIEDQVTDLAQQSELQEGVIVRMKVVTPHKDNAQFVHDTFMKQLKELGRKAGQGFYINRVFLLKGGQQLSAGFGTPEDAGTEDVILDPREFGGGPARGAGGGGRGAAAGPLLRKRPPRGGGGGPGSPSGVGRLIHATDVPGFDIAAARQVDPVTGEAVGTDWTFTIVFDVVFADLPEGYGTAEEEGAAPEDGAAVEPSPGEARDGR